MDRLRAKKEWDDDEAGDDLESPEPDDREPEPDDFKELEVSPSDDEPGGFEFDEDDDGLAFPIGTGAPE